MTVRQGRRGRPVAGAGAAAALPGVLQDMRLLWALVHALQKTSKRMRQTLGVTGPQRLVIRVLGLLPGSSAGDLAAMLHVHPSTLTGVLARLVDQRYITRTPDPDDRRRSVLLLTRRGSQVNARLDGTAESSVSRALRRLTDRERQNFRVALSELTDALELPARGRTPGRRTNVRR
ncbi:MAG: MarR family winged helix-turn-helix transcriptional regulator [Vicinamibacterales bacterium]